ncbi:3-oxoacyl-[acyl-carrier-protein] synthase III C-terminal domain-containing protein [Pigmentibacter ruber]|uniref:3-oxoacyl-[acyl-carrier-protein] synthase III C-terminal domain-containing protein n=1 Tax=Pigmentibacter ruber TaxID=2683196 RepID=UPI00131C63FB|nr:3-oxoacyl-[acyl-carrier-protein] synthase III C-terminal domain-containing protein [Pigmentibacter ruber]
MQFILSDFRILRPKYEVPQAEGLNWISLAHSYAKFIEGNINKSNSKTMDEIYKQVANICNRFACKPDKISNRGTSIQDYSHQDWENMQLFDFKKSFAGAGINERMQLFSAVVDEVFQMFYQDNMLAPKHIVHVSCTGYVSPSPAQKIVGQKNWGEKTKVTHAYHMGCYASLPALRIANGFLSTDIEKYTDLYSKKDPYLDRVDIVHTELCTLHFNPSIHDPSQFVIQSLFADGFITYSIFNSEHYLKTSNEKAFLFLIDHEEIIPKTEDAMSWEVSEFGFFMTLSGKVPNIISENIERFLNKMCAKIGLIFNEIKDSTLFAIHPGGSKIIHYIQEILQLPKESILYSENILFQYGNMSSATLPHIWQNILQDFPDQNKLVISLAFGPGLTVSGSIMRVV